MPKKKSKRGDAMKKRWEVAKEAGMASLGDTSFGAAMEERDSDYEEAGTRTPAAFPLSCSGHLARAASPPCPWAPPRAQRARAPCACELTTGLLSLLCAPRRAKQASGLIPRRASFPLPSPPPGSSRSEVESGGEGEHDGSAAGAEPGGAAKQWENRRRWRKSHEGKKAVARSGDVTSFFPPSEQEKERYMAEYRNGVYGNEAVRVMAAHQCRRHRGLDKSRARQVEAALAAAAGLQ